MDAEKALAHVGHNVAIVTYGAVNVAVECEDCDEIVTDADLATEGER